MMEYWNNVLKTYDFSVRIKVFGINFHYLSMMGLSHKSYFFPMRCKKDPIFQYSIVPSFSAYGG